MSDPPPITPPPALYRPHSDAMLLPALDAVMDSMERLAQWMYETAREMERLASEGKRDER